MLEITQQADSQSIVIKDKWFNGEIHLDNRAIIPPFQLRILDKFITQVIAQSNEATGINLDFYIIITGDPKESDFAVDLFAFLDGITINDQDVFNNSFSAIHWGLSSIITIISQLYSGLINKVPTDFFYPDPDRNSIDYQDSETIN